MKKKVGILTLNGYFNYGNRLQNYALQKSIEDLGFEVLTVRVQVTGSGLDKKLDWAFRQIVRRLFLSLKKMIKSEPKKTKEDLMREEHFLGFSKKWIKETEYLIDINQIPSTLKDNFDYFVAGSDQVWSPQYFGNPRIYFMGFADSQQRISYAASFGSAEIPDHLKEIYREGIGKIRACSVREVSGVKIVKELTGKEPNLVLDPTLLLSKKDWESLCPSDCLLEEKKYLLVYFLGQQTAEYKKYIHHISAMKQLEIIDILDKKSEYYQCDPSEFVNLIRNATFICTDSFHGTVFSILFERNFIVFPKVSNEASMFSRIETLLTLFKLEDRVFEETSEKALFDTDYSAKEGILNEERKKSVAFLEKALEVVK